MMSSTTTIEKISPPSRRRPIHSRGAVCSTADGGRNPRRPDRDAPLEPAGFVLDQTKISARPPSILSLSYTVTPVRAEYVGAGISMAPQSSTATGDQAVLMSGAEAPSFEGMGPQMAGPATASTFMTVLIVAGLSFGAQVLSGHRAGRAALRR